MNKKSPLMLLILMVAISIPLMIDNAFAKPNAKAFKKMLDAHSKAPKIQKRNFQDIASSGALIALGLTSPAADGPPAALKSRLSPTPGGNTAFTPIINQQSETTIAVHGLNVVSGFNDFRGFAVNSVSGVAYSTDGGATFTDNNQLPLDGSGNDFVGGDPDVKVWQDPISLTVYFFYSSIYFPDAVTSSLSVHVSTDGGATWSAPRVVTSASSAVDFADKEYISVDKETGRLFVSWSNFKADGTIEMAVSYSDDQGQTWSPKISISNRTNNKTFDGQGTITRAAPNSSNVYIAWTTFGLVDPFGNGISFAKSTDNGATWSAPDNIFVNKPSAEAAYGFDRVNGNAALEVDSVGYIYLANILAPKKPKINDFGDLELRTSTNGGNSWSKRVFIGRSPKKDNRTQMFPWISVDRTTGVVDVIWYDQRSGTGFSDFTEAYHVHSFDQGQTFTCPEPVSPTRFQSEFGNNFNAPHQGDYIQVFSDNGMWADYAAPPRDPAHGDSMIDFEVARQTQGPGLGATVGDISVNGVVGGIVDPGTTMSLIVPLRSNCGKFDSVDATLTSLSPSATVTVADSVYSPLKKKKFSNNVPAYQVAIDPAAPLGKYLDFELAIDTAAGATLGAGALTGIVRFRLIVGQPVVGAVFKTEDFESVVPPGLPAGWTYVPIFGTGTPWMTVASQGNPGIAAFVADIDTNSFDRLQSPFFPLPGGADFYDIEFDINYNEEVATSRTGFDGGSLTLRFNDGGSSIFASAFATEFDGRYEHRLERSAGGQSGDRSAWSGNSGGFRHIRIRIPAKDVAGVDLTSIQFRFDQTSDSSVGAVGWWVDNVTIKPVNYTDP